MLSSLRGVRQDSTSGDFKTALTDVLVQRICPIGAEIERLLRDPQHIDGVLERGAASARGIAHDTMSRVRRLQGLC